MLLCCAPSEALPQETLNIATFGGAYGRAQEITLLEPYAKKTGTVIATEIYDGDTAKLRTLIENTKTPVDIVDVSAGALNTLCDEGLLAPIDAASLKTDGDEADDFLPGAVSKCGVASTAWAMAIVVNRKAVGGSAPASIAALLDTDRFPGKRALPNNAPRTLELALLADGVGHDGVYKQLATPEGADRAFAALDRIKDSVLLWNSPAEPMAWLNAGRATMAAGYSGRIFRAAIGDRNLEIVWDGQIYDIDAWAIPKTARNMTGAMRFIRFATAPAQLAAQARLTAYGPMRVSALTQVGAHPAIGVDMQRFLPTTPGNSRNALKFDQVWWERNGAPLKQRFAAWAAGLGARAPASPGQPEANEANTQAAPETSAP